MKNTVKNDLGLSIDMLDADMLRRLADALAARGMDAVVLVNLADRLETAVREIGQLREVPPRWDFRDKKGRFRSCRLSPAKLEAFYDDPMTEASGCGGEFVGEWRRKDVREGCPRCRAEAAENASEPDVMARWRSA